jgi:hypothetical protein
VFRFDTWIAEAFGNGSAEIENAKKRLAAKAEDAAARIQR